MQILHSVQDDKSGLHRKVEARREAGLLCCCSCEQSERPPARQVLFGGHFFGFAFLAHDFEFAFLRLDLCGHFLLDALCRFFQFW